MRERGRMECFLLDDQDDIAQIAKPKSKVRATESGRRKDDRERTQRSDQHSHSLLEIPNKSNPKDKMAMPEHETKKHTLPVPDHLHGPKRAWIACSRESVHNPWLWERTARAMEAKCSSRERKRENHRTARAPRGEMLERTRLSGNTEGLREGFVGSKLPTITSFYPTEGNDFDLHERERALVTCSKESSHKPLPVTRDQTTATKTPRKWMTMSR